MTIDRKGAVESAVGGCHDGDVVELRNRQIECKAPVVGSGSRHIAVALEGSPVFQHRRGVADKRSRLRLIGLAVLDIGDFDGVEIGLVVSYNGSFDLGGFSVLIVGDIHARNGVALRGGAAQLGDCRNVVGDRRAVIAAALNIRAAGTERRHRDDERCRRSRKSF